MSPTDTPPADKPRTPEDLLREVGFTEAAEYLVKNRITRDDVKAMSPDQVAELDPTIVQAIVSGDELAVAVAVLRAGGFDKEADWLEEQTLTRDKLKAMSPEEVAKLDPAKVETALGRGTP